MRTPAPAPAPSPAAAPAAPAAPPAADRPARGLAGLHRDEVEARVVALGQPRYRAQQILAWVHRRRARTYEGLSDLPAGLRRRLAAEVPLLATTVKAAQDAGDGTRKLLLALPDGDAVEAVLIPEADRRTLCVSTQVGCPVGCIFCASGLGGLVRNLAPDEIVEQVLHAESLLPPAEKLTNLVVMGMGEPFLNYAALIRALEILEADWGVGLGSNRITVSTVGVLDKVARFAAEPVATNLALSLHAPNDVVRRRLLPRFAAVTIAQVIAAAADYRTRTGKDVTFEYVLLAGENCAPEHAEELADRVGGLGCKVNLIPWNGVSGIDLKTPTERDVRRFEEILERRGVPTTCRRRRGDDIAAACGQLRLRHLDR
ncbi:MAG: 23S rRNA (adenine(2503)-C(2))-methyltransferase RlmN [Planctomycetes bacterium]|nr:23S rRNA (adenine(2503)-C(2))-methyltransferase RlmN [Planctomycetota bacterium]